MTNGDCHTWLLQDLTVLLLLPTMQQLEVCYLHKKGIWNVALKQGQPSEHTLEPEDTLWSSSAAGTQQSASKHPSYTLRSSLSPQGHAVAKAQHMAVLQKGSERMYLFVETLQVRAPQSFPPISAPSPLGRTIWAVHEEWRSPRIGNAAHLGRGRKGPVLEAGRGACHCPSTSNTAPQTQTLTGCSRTDVVVTALWSTAGSSPPVQLCLPLRALELCPPVHPPHQNLPLEVGFSWNQLIQLHWNKAAVSRASLPAIPALPNRHLCELEGSWLQV